MMTLGAHPGAGGDARNPDRRPEAQVCSKAGDVIFVPTGASHNATNVGKATAKVLAT